MTMFGDKQLRGKGGAGRQLERLSGSWFPPGFGTSDPIPRCFPLEDFGGLPSIWGSQSRARVGSLIEESQPVAPLPPQKCSRGTIIYFSSTMNPLEYLSHFLPACVGCVTALLLLRGKTNCSFRANNPFLKASQALNLGTDLSHTLLNHPG